MRFLAVQIGARRSYAVPVALQNAGMLERFYTDITADVGFGRWLVKCGPLLGFRRAAARLAARRLPDSIRAKTVTFGRPNLWFACNRALCSPDPAARFCEQLRWNRALGSAMIRRGFGDATHLYSMLGECRPMLAESKKRGLTVVTEFYIPLSTEQVVAREHRAFPEWEPLPPDLNMVRRQFPNEENLLAFTDHALCPAEPVRLDLETNFGFPSQLSAVVPYGVDASWLKLAPQPEPGRVLFVGTAGLRKGIHYLAMAAEHLHSLGRPYEFRVAGDFAPNVPHLSAAHYLLFLGRIPRSRIQAEFAAADVFALPSLVEGSAEATYEALAAGVPVVTTPGAGSVVRHQVEGLIIPEREPEALAMAIDQIVQDRQLRKHMASCARRRARQFTLDRYGDRLIAALRRFKPCERP